MGGWLIMTEGRCSKPQPTTTAVIKTRSSRMCSRVIAGGWGDQASTRGIWSHVSMLYEGHWVRVVSEYLVYVTIRGNCEGIERKRTATTAALPFMEGRKEDDPRRRFDTAGANERERSFCPLTPFPPHASCDATPKNGLDLILIHMGTRFNHFQVSHEVSDK